MLVVLLVAALALATTQASQAQKCLKGRYVVACTAQCKTSTASVCRRSCRSSGRGRAECRGLCKGDQDSCINECVVASEVKAGCLAPFTRRPVRETRRRRRSVSRGSRRRRRRGGRRGDVGRRRRRQGDGRRRRRRASAAAPKRRSKRSSKGARCGKARLGRLRSRLVKLSRRAAACGDEDSACVDKAYKRIAALKLNIVKCGGKVRVRARCAKNCSSKCVTRLQARLTKLQKKQCSDLDQGCIRRHLNRLLETHARLTRCAKKGAKGALAVKKNLRPVIKCPLWVHQAEYRRAVTCDRLNVKFRAWMRFTRCRRQRAFEQSHRCASSNTACLRHSYRVILRMHQKLHAAHQEFVHLVDRCDECAPLKLRFYQWLLKQRRRRHRAHLRACACGALDVECLQDNVNTIKRIQDRITLRRRQVLALHSDCRAQRGRFAATNNPTTFMDLDDSLPLLTSTAVGTLPPLPTQAPAVVVAPGSVPVALTGPLPSASGTGMAPIMPKVVKVDNLAGGAPAPGEFRVMN